MQTGDTFVGQKRRYHVESLISDTPCGKVYRVFARRRQGKTIKRRYYAIIVSNENVSDTDFNSNMQGSLLAMPYAVRIEEEFVDKGDNRCVVVAKGERPNDTLAPFRRYLNHGYLMLILAFVIVVLMIIRYFQH